MKIIIRSLKISLVIVLVYFGLGTTLLFHYGDIPPTYFKMLFYPIDFASIVFFAGGGYEGFFTLLFFELLVAFIAILVITILILKVKSVQTKSKTLEQ